MGLVLATPAGVLALTGFGRLDLAATIFVAEFAIYFLTAALII